MNRIEEYVDKCFRDIPYSEKKEQLRQEILQNLQEKVLDLMEQGKSQEDAENKTIIEFGDIDDIKQELLKGVVTEKPVDVKKYRLRFGYSVCGSALIIAILIFVDLSYTPHIKWFVYPALGVLWWPLTMAYQWLKHK